MASGGGGSSAVSGASISAGETPTARWAACCRHLAGRPNGRGLYEFARKAERLSGLGWWRQFGCFRRFHFCRRDANSTLCSVLPASCWQTERKRALRIRKQGRAPQWPRVAAAVRLFPGASISAGETPTARCAACCRHPAGRPNGRGPYEFASKAERLSGLGWRRQFGCFRVLPFLPARRQQHVRQRAVDILAVVWDRGKRMLARCRMRDAEVV